MLKPTRPDAILFSLGANAAHGLRRTNEDKRRAVLTMLRDEEWVTWSDHEISRRCAAHQTYVTKLRPPKCALNEAAPRQEE